MRRLEWGAVYNRSKEKELRECTICGDIATGYNFNALTCESCKAFFRRNAIKGIKSCSVEGKCVINLSTRRICGYCRLEKCFNTGMKKEWIWNEEAKECRKMKIEMNRYRRQLMQQKQANIKSTDTVSSTTVFATGADSPLDSDVINQSANISFILSIMTKSGNNHFSHSNSQSSDNSGDSIGDQTPTQTSISDEVYRKAVEMEMSVTPVSRPHLHFGHTFTESEGNRFTELLFAAKLLQNHMKAYTSQITTVNDYFHTLDIKFEQEVRKLIKSFKMLMCFNDICEQDRHTLVKHGSNENSIIKVQLNIMQENDNYYLELIEYFKKLKQEMELDNRILDMMTAIILFNPDIYGLVNRDAISSICEANGKFLRLLNSLIFLGAFNDKIRKTVSGRPRNHKSELIDEIMYCDNTNNMLGCVI
ncbi:unnamed protein product [Medioppia subpectinata]|uniref:Nuclear receptor domain-containing protein n=1 Tax=Medioppia subpectinata TaxID=1979941 RepID=A0A7R9PUS9_9ACAR|nr:unnamed protein product [Medioppia subpectinata]CAG2101553.1 unnamed protein product [Medioppia subpectinata]